MLILKTENQNRTKSMKPKASSLKISMKMTNLYQNEGWGRREGGREKEKERELVVLGMKKGK